MLVFPLFAVWESLFLTLTVILCSQRFKDSTLHVWTKGSNKRWGKERVRRCMIHFAKATIKSKQFKETIRSKTGTEKERK